MPYSIPENTHFFTSVSFGPLNVTFNVFIFKAFIRGVAGLLTPLGALYHRAGGVSGGKVDLTWSVQVHPEQCSALHWIYRQSQVEKNCSSTLGHFCQLHCRIKDSKLHFKLIIITVKGRYLRKLCIFCKSFIN